MKKRKAGHYLSRRTRHPIIQTPPVAKESQHSPQLVYGPAPGKTVPPSSKRHFTLQDCSMENHAMLCRWGVLSKETVSVCQCQRMKLNSLYLPKCAPQMFLNLRTYLPLCTHRIPEIAAACLLGDSCTHSQTSLDYRICWPANYEDKQNECGVHIEYRYSEPYDVRCLPALRRLT